jgi:predicted RNA-binding Zn-ribbon protein involved in translation (DUF1610 family)
MTDSITTTASVLVQHPSIPKVPQPADGPSYRCPSCPDAQVAGPNSPSHARHQATALAAAGVLRLEGDLSHIELTQTWGQPTHVHIERTIDGARVLLVNGYVAATPSGAVELAHLGRHERSRPTAPHAGDPAEPLENRLQALAADMARDAPFTAEILRQFATEAAQLRAPRDGNPAGFSLASLPCPQCGQRRIMGYRMDDEQGKHMHTHYVCTFWGTGQTKACGWHGWSVPGWDKDTTGDDD